jgi:hypothetical protein
LKIKINALLEKARARTNENDCNMTLLTDTKTIITLCSALIEAREALEQITNHHGFDSSTPGEAVALASYCLSETTLENLNAKIDFGDNNE